MKNISALVAALLLTGILGLSASSVMADEFWDEAYEAINDFVNDGE
ncbi:MAG: hypothetical protein V3U04_01395 [Candidatus Aerophobetes bacterium]